MRVMKTTFMALTVAGTAFVAGCGGGGGGSSADPATPVTETRNDVIGPLDGLQGGLSTEILAPLDNAVAGTPLASVVDCLDQSVVNDILDIADAVALGVRPGAADPAAQLNATAAQVQAEAGDLVADLQGFVVSLAGSAGCTSDAAARAATGNPLAGTPLASLGTQLLPVLDQVQGQLGVAPGTLSLGEISYLLGLVRQAFDDAAGAIPADAANAPVVGGVLVVLSHALMDVQFTVAAASSGNPVNASSQVISTVQNVLDGVLTQVLPVAMIEDTSGQPGVVSGPMQDAMDELTAVLGGGLSNMSSADLGSALENPMALLLDPLNTEVLPPILGPIQQAIADGDGGGSIPVVTGTPLDSVLATITGVLSGGAGGDPLSSLLGSVLGGSGTDGSCSLWGTALAAMCGALSV